MLGTRLLIAFGVLAAAGFAIAIALRNPDTRAWRWLDGISD